MLCHYEAKPNQSWEWQVEIPRDSTKRCPAHYSLQNVHSAPGGGLCPRMATALEKWHRVFGKVAESSDKDGTGTQSLALRAETAAFGSDCSIGECRTRGNLIETYKIMTGREAVEREQFFQLSACDYNLRGHIMSLSKQRACSLDVQSACGRERVKLAVTSTGRGCYVVNQFKNRLDKYRQRYMYCH